MSVKRRSSPTSESGIESVVATPDLEAERGVGHRPVRVRRQPARGAIACDRGGRTRKVGLGGVAIHPALAGAAAMRAPGGVRRGVLSVPHASPDPRGTQPNEAPETPGRFHRLYFMVPLDDTCPMRAAYHRVSRSFLGVLLASAIVFGLAEQLAPELHDRDGSNAVLVDAPLERDHGGPWGGHSADVVHLCHCSHVHLGTSAAAATSGSVRVSSARSHRGNEMAPRSANRDSIFRPPIA